jgi:3-dehydroquinate synthase
MSDKEELVGVRCLNRSSATVTNRATAENCQRTASGGVTLWASDREVRLELAATRHIRYATVHPSGYVLDRTNPALRDAADGRPILAVIDRQVYNLYKNDLQSYLANEINLSGIVLIDGSEHAKTWPAVQRICEGAIRVQLPRDGLIVAVGGGVTLDVAGFAASIFRRGVPYVRIPTSLIGMVDVGVGVKQGINAGGTKSIIGAFYPAMLNINDPTFLATLPERHISCGMAEIIKMALVRDTQLFEELECRASELVCRQFQNSPDAGNILVRAEQLLMEELQPNLFELELQRLPDFGHSFSPAIEAASRWSVNHGEAVALDMLISTAVSVVKGLCAQNVLDRLWNLLCSARLPTSHPVCKPRLLFDSLRGVRAHRAGNLNLVAPTSVGCATFLQEITVGEISSAVTLLWGGKIVNAGITRRPRWDTSALRTVA